MVISIMRYVGVILVGWFVLAAAVSVMVGRWLDHQPQPRPVMQHKPVRPAAAVVPFIR